MNSEDVIVYFTALVAIGMIVVGLLTTVLHSYQIAPIVIIGVVLAIFVLLGTTNAVNLTDGVDGLASSVTAIIITCLTIVSIKLGVTEISTIGMILIPYLMKRQIK